MSNQLQFITSSANANGYPLTPGFKENQTSRDAAKAVQSRTEKARAKILELLRVHPQTADETAAIMGETTGFIRPRFSELRLAKQIEPSGKRKCNASGMTAHCWKVK